MLLDLLFEGSLAFIYLTVMPIGHLLYQNFIVCLAAILEQYLVNFPNSRDGPKVILCGGQYFLEQLKKAD